MKRGLTEKPVADGVLRKPPPADPADLLRWLGELDMWAAGQGRFAPESEGASALSEARGFVRKARRALNAGDAESATWAGMRAIHAMFLAMLRDAWPMIDIGVSNFRTFERANLARNARVRDEADHWQALAESKWSEPQHAGKSKLAIARLIAPGDYNRIRKLIEKPTEK